MSTKTKSRWQAGLAAALLVAVIAAWNWPMIVFGLAAASAETRPELLRDADLNAPGSARQFGNRFAAGTPETDLLAWLTSNSFAVDRVARNATRTVASLPCNEDIRVAWKSKQDGTLDTTSVVVSDAGCL